MKNPSLKKAAILSISTLIILMNATIVPLLSKVQAVFPDANPALIKMALSLPALMSIFFSFSVGYLTRFLPKKGVLFLGLLLFGTGGVGAGLTSTISAFLALRAVLGAGAGLVSPLAADFIGDFYKGNDRAKMIGYGNSAANLSAVCLPLLAGRLSELNWRFAFLVYLIAFLIMGFSMLFIPPQPEKTPQKDDQKTNPAPVTWRAVVLALMNFYLVLFFYTIPSNLSVFIATEGIGTPTTAALAMSLSTLVSMLFSMNFARIHSRTGDWLLPAGLLFISAGFGVISLFPGLVSVMAGEVLIGVALGLVFPYFPFRVMQVVQPSASTRALSLLSAAFGMGMFLSQFFFTGVSRLFPIETISGEFGFSSLALLAAALVSIILVQRFTSSRVPSG